MKLTMDQRLALSENDEDNARRILSEYGEDLLFVTGRNWAVWDGTRFSFSRGDLRAFGVASKLRGLVEAEADYAESEWRPPERLVLDALKRSTKATIDAHGGGAGIVRAETARRLRRHAVKCGNVAKIKAALESLAHRRAWDVEDLDSDPFQFVCANGQLDLLTARKAEFPEGATEEEIAAVRASWLKPEIDRTPLPTRAAPTAYDPHATCPQFEAFLELICPDAAIRACLWRIMGAMLFGENKAQVCIIIKGPGGNGKSTLLNALQAVLGTVSGYAATAKVDMFLDTGFASSSGATPEEVDLPGARVWVATEPGARDVLSAKNLKGLTGGDRRMSRGLFKESFFWTPSGLPIISCNRMVKIKDEDEGTRRRLVILPLEVNLRALPADKQIAPGKADKMFAAEAPGILNRMVDGFRDFWAQGIAPPPAMDAIKGALMEAADPVGVFLDEMTVKGDPSRSRIGVTEFYKVHEAWAQAEGRTLYQMKTVGDIMIEKGIERGKFQGLSTWRGLSWAPSAAPLLESLGYGPPMTEAEAQAVEEARADGF